jgi:hypothetical protein
MRWNGFFGSAGKSICNRSLDSSAASELGAEESRIVVILTMSQSQYATLAADPSAPSRDRCFLEVANNTDNVHLCERMTPAALEPVVQDAVAHGVRAPIAEQMGLHGDCLRIAKRVGPAPYYGPALPVRDEQIRRLLAALHVAVPLARDWSAERQADYYRSFLVTLWPTSAPEAVRDRTRAQLVARLLALSAVP